MRLRRVEHALQRLRSLLDCDGFPCAVHGKSDAEVLGVRPALEHPNVTLLVNARVERLETDAGGGSVTGVVVTRDGQEERYTADLVVLACGAANTAAVLLNSAGDRHPNGLANGSDQVGRNYMFHNSQAVLALSLEENPTVFQKTLGVNDFYFGADDVDYPLGNIQMVGKSQAADVPRREAGRDQVRATLVAGDSGPPRRRLLALDRRPAAAGQPGDASTATGGSTWRTRRPTMSPNAGCTRSCGRCSASWACTRTTCCTGSRT